MAASYSSTEWPDFLGSSILTFPILVAWGIHTSRFQTYHPSINTTIKKSAGHLLTYAHLITHPATINRSQAHHVTMLSLLFTLLLSLLHLTSAISVPNPQPSAPEVLSARQVSATPSQADLCLDYEVTANMSTIGANSTYRTVLLQKSNVGTIYNARMMDAAIKKLPALTADAALNSNCGNKTEIALREAERNFTMGVVAQFTTEGLPVGILAGPLVLGICGGIATLFSIVWISG